MVEVELDKAIKILETLAMVNTKLGKLESEFRHSVASKQLIQLFSLQESVESSRIEGTQVTFIDMMEQATVKSPRSEVVEVRNYFDALNMGYEAVRNGYPVSTRMIKQLHEVLMAGSRGEVSSAGQFRKIQNFIGPTNRIEDASYIPVPVNEIDAYMENLEVFINTDAYGRMLPTNHLKGASYCFDEDSAPLIKTAILHAQFESIHPFLDGNGRLGRILIVIYLLQQKIINIPVFFVSEELEKEQTRYYDMLNGVRGENPDWGSWILFFLNACSRMADKLIRKLENAERLAQEGNERLTKEAERLIWLNSFEEPVTTAASMSKRTGYSIATTRRILNDLVDKGLLYVSPSEIRNRKYRNYELIRLLAD
ncbi:Fic family protein [Exiguobacterium flavidum]|uniref:Fic family protein n=1 Tax=Exiguobacterium flavidum TaxID=2184695 RepID=UPI000DF7F47B|nr:Fic family protein [Exiguobacterium flavidum]